MTNNNRKKAPIVPNTRGGTRNEASNMARTEDLAAMSPGIKPDIGLKRASELKLKNTIQNTRAISLKKIGNMPN
jgi:hypothetical protein